MKIMTTLKTANKHYLDAAEHLEKFGFDLFTDNYMSIGWAAKVGNELEGYISVNDLAGDQHANFYIKIDMPLEASPTDEATVLVKANRGFIQIEVPVAELKNIPEPKGNPGYRRDLCKVSTLHVV